MKKFILIIAIAFIGTYCFSQKVQPEQVPAIVKQMLQSKFPQTIQIPVDWTKDKRTYKATITIMDAPATMSIDSLGQILSIERKIHENYLPKKAKEQLKALDPAYQIVDIIQVTDEKGTVIYKTAAKITTKFTFDSNGGIIKGAK